VRLVPGARRLPDKDKNVSGFEKIVDEHGEEIPLAQLLPHRRQWFEAIATAIDALRAVLAKKMP